MRAARRFALAVALLSSLACRPPEEECLEPLSLGGDFALTGTDGRPFRLSSLRGRVVLLFFGYTACPDVCPTTIARLSRAMNLLKKERPKAAVSIVFVSVDAERDTPERLRDYLAYFALPVQGATGTEAEVAPVLRTFGASFEKVPIQSALKYRIDHTAYVYLIDPLGRTVHLFGHSDPPEEIARLVSRVLAGHTCGGTPTAGAPGPPPAAAKGRASLQGEGTPYPSQQGPAEPIGTILN